MKSIKNILFILLCFVVIIISVGVTIFVQLQDFLIIKYNIIYYVSTHKLPIIGIILGLSIACYLFVKEIKKQIYQEKINTIIKNDENKLVENKQSFFGGALNVWVTIHYIIIFICPILLGITKGILDYLKITISIINVICDNFLTIIILLFLSSMVIGFILILLDGKDEQEDNFPELGSYKEDYYDGY